MRNTARALALISALLPVAAAAQQFPTVADHTVIGRVGIGGSSGPSQAIPFALFLSNLGGVQSANTVWAGPTSGGANVPAFRLLVGADLPVPGASSLGGVQSLTCATSNWFRTLSTGGVFGCSQPAFSDISGSIAATQLPNPSATTLGGVKSLAAISHNFLTSISTAGQPTQAQPACTDLSDATSCNAARGQLPGEASTGNASAGNVGEYIESVVAQASAVSLTTATAKDITTLVLTAGDWDIDANVGFVTASTTSITQMFCGISTTLNTMDFTAGRAAGQVINATVPTAGANYFLPVQPIRVSISGSTTYHLVATGTFTASTLTAFGIIRARRVR